MSRYDDMMQGRSIHKRSHWTDYLPDDVYRRLCACRTSYDDIPKLVNSRWAWMKEKGMDDHGYTKEDAVIYVLDLLDANGLDIEITKDEYIELSR